ncbi:MAG: hypothetical protein EBS42_14150, partial [Caulobacteraceae bacterium]|nr:hypothetical protein [Caulobacteraceae bacterium]
MTGSEQSETIDFGRLVSHVAALIKSHGAMLAFIVLLFVGVPEFLKALWRFTTGEYVPLLGLAPAFVLNFLGLSAVVTASLQHSQGEDVRLGGVLSEAWHALPQTIAISFIQTLGVMLGLMMLVVPGLYLI